MILATLVCSGKRGVVKLRPLVPAWRYVLVSMRRARLRLGLDACFFRTRNVDESGLGTVGVHGVYQTRRLGGHASTRCHEKISCNH